MLVRLWWKDARQLLPIWGLVALFGLGIQGLVARYLPDMVREGGLLAMAEFWACLYACLAATAAFAGEREARTMTLLDTMPAPRREVWLAKSSFALATAAALALFLFLCAGLSEGGWPWIERSEFRFSPATAIGIGLLVLIVVVSNGLFWSSWMKNVLMAASLAILTTFLTSPVGVSTYTGTTGSELTPVLGSLAVAAVLTVSSYLAFLRSGPPARPLVAVPERPRGTRRSTAVEAMRADEDGQAESRPAWGRSAASRIAWQAFREIRSVAPWLVLIGVVIPAVYSFFAVGHEAFELWIGNVGVVALLVGLNVFGMETRAGTQRLLASHGVRPGVVWFVRLSAWFLPLFVILSVDAALLLWLTGTRHIPWASLTGDYPRSFLALLGVCLVPVAVGSLSGMVFRRGIMAGAVAVLGVILLAAIVGAPTVGQLVNPRYIVVVPLAILVVSFLWRWDWLLDRPGLGRWTRLIGLGVGASVLVLAGYVAERAWNVPTLSPESDAETFTIRLPARVPPAENAAELYQQASRSLKRPEMAAAMGSPPPAPEQSDNKVTSSFLKDNADLLPLIRRASAMPSCQLVDLEHRTFFSGFSGFLDMWRLRMLLVDSARERRSKGDLKGAWEDIIAVFRMARQQSGTVPIFIAEHGQQTEGTALWLAWNWAADARQTPDLLQMALDEFLKLPQMPSLADPYRVEALMARNAERLPRSDYADKVKEFMLNPTAKRQESVSPLQTLYLDVLASPWERSRLSRVARLYLAAAIQDALRPPAQSERADLRNNLGRWRSLPAWTGSGGFVSREEMDEFINTSPLAQQMLPISFRYMMDADANEVSRRALVQILGLRIYQARHDGKLPERLDDLVRAGILRELPTDPFTWPAKPFGYVPSAGQKLLSLEDLSFLSLPKDTRPTQGYRLLYSEGWDRHDDKAQSNAAWVGVPGDIIFPLPDNVPPPK